MITRLPVNHSRRETETLGARWKKAAAIVRTIGPVEWPKDPRGMAAPPLAAREAFVVLFTGEYGFDADAFRKDCEVRS